MKSSLSGQNAAQTTKNAGKTAEKPEKRIGLFGGSFDPVHKDHVKICDLFLKACALDYIIIMPAFLSPFKTESGADAGERLKMLEIAFSSLIKQKKAIISNEEILREGKSYTFETVENIKSRLKNNGENAELYLLIGEDSALTFDKWKNPGVILSHAKITIAGRAGGNLSKTGEYFEKQNAAYLKEKPTYIPFDGNCASSLIREYLKLGLSAEKFLPCGVSEYIKSRNLYCANDLYHEFMRKNSTEKRLEHTAGVVYLARKYAKRLGVSEQKAAVAALLHDCAKYLNAEGYFNSGFTLDKEVPPPVIHQFLGAFVAKTVLNVTDEEILSAIRWHTTGRENMTKLEKIIFVADLIEPSRDYGEVNELRAAVEENFEQGFLLCVKRIYRYLKKDNEPLYMTDKTYAYYIKNA